MPVSTPPMPGEYGKQKQFVDQQAIDRCMENCLKDFGIDVLKRLEEQYIEKAGTLPFNPGLIRQVCRQIASDQSH